MGPSTQKPRLSSQQLWPGLFESLAIEAVFSKTTAAPLRVPRGYSSGPQLLQLRPMGQMAWLTVYHAEQRLWLL
ncbi:hypothetical protein P7K49_014892, partial [Saguinus oedipus]